MGHGPNGSPEIDPSVGAPQSDICYHYKKALLKAIATDRATKQEEREAKGSKRPISRLYDRFCGNSLYKMVVRTLEQRS